MSNLRSDARDWVKRTRVSEVAGLNNAITYVNSLCNQIDQIEEDMHIAVRARNNVITELSNALTGKDSMPVAYRNLGGKSFALYGAMSIEYADALEEQIADMLRNREKDINERCQQIAVDKTKKAMEDVDKKSGEENRPPGLYCNQCDIKIAEVEDLNHTDVRCPLCGAIYSRL